MTIMQLVIDNTCDPCNTCQKLQGYCECTCSFCTRHKSNVPDRMLVSAGDPNVMICKDCVRNAKEMIR